MIKNFLKNLDIILLSAAISFTFGFSLGGIKETMVLAGPRMFEIKIEDILILFLGLIWLADILISGKKKLKKSPLFFPIIVWLGIGLLGVLTNWIFTNIGLYRGFFYFLKEVEFFFLYFYLFHHIKSIDSAKFIVKIWIILGLINVGWVIYQMIEGIVGYYGPGAIGEESGSFSSGCFFLIIFIFFFNIFLFYYFNLNISLFKKAILCLFSFSPVLGVFASGSRASAVGFFFAVPFTLFLYSLKEKRKRKLLFVLISISLIAIMSYFLLFSKMEVAKRGLTFWRTISWELSSKDSETRFNIWKVNTNEFLKHPFFLFFGMGKSAYLVHEESHSQYVRNFIETGIIGSLAFFFLIFAIIRKSFRDFLLNNDPFVIALASGLLATTLAMLLISLTVEAFIIVKVAETYWFFCALTMAVLTFQKQKNATPSSTS